MPPPPARAPGRCTCGGLPGPGGECAQCRARRLGLRRAPGSSVSHLVAPPIVQQVLASRGKPLDGSSRAFFEPRLAADLGDVRVHSDARAARSAAAVGALAYTVGRDVVFAAGRHAPHTGGGRALLAHELVHVVQQRSAPATVRRQPAQAAATPTGRLQTPEVPDPDRTLQVDCVKRVGGCWRPGPAGLPTPEEMAEHNRRCRGETGYAGPDVAPSGEECMDPITVRGICGPDVTKPLEAIVDRTKARFAHWSTDLRQRACDGLVSYMTGLNAWDVAELHSNAWILGYRPACATSGAEPRCGSSVQVGADCHYAGSANYVIFGVMCKLCEDHFRASGSPRPNDFSREAMLGWINLYKGWSVITVPQFGPAWNFETSQAWASAGYDGWPSAPAPPGDRENCLPVCAAPHTGRFRVYWDPFVIR